MELHREALLSLTRQSRVWATWCGGAEEAAGGGGVVGVSEEEYCWAFATVVSRAVRFGDRSDRSSWSTLFMEPVGDLLNHADSEHATVFRFLNQVSLRSTNGPTVIPVSDRPPHRNTPQHTTGQGENRIQYHAADNGLEQGQELVYQYGPLNHADALLW